MIGSRRTAPFVLAGLALALSAASATAANAAPEPGERRERLVRSESPDARRVKESYVRVYAPLPDEVGPHPARCDWVGYLRFRHRKGPPDSSGADAVAVSMPGILAGASMHDQLARNFVTAAARRGRHAEYWALDRRSNCLEDHRGVRAAARERDAGIAMDYYYGDGQVRRRRFGGFKSPQEADWLAEVGLEQTLRDWYDVIREGIPSRRRRARSLLCGGHSLGGPLTGSFAGWDFDGDPATRKDAGYRQCAGLFGLDTSLEVSEGEEGIGIAQGLAAASAGSPYLMVPPFTPETIQILGPLGIAAYHQPDRRSAIAANLPMTPNFELSTRLIFARNAVEFATGMPSPRDFRVTNETALAATWDDNSTTVTIMRTSLGAFDGGPVVQKHFPTPGGTFSAPLLDNSYLMAPETPNGPLYSWRDFDRIGARNAPEQLTDSGEPFTSPRSEVADLHAFARAQFEAPADFAEQYFPTRIATDVESAAQGDRSGDLENLRYDGESKRPAVLIQAGDSDENSGGAAAEKRTWERDGIGGELTIPGYNHIDVVFAARRQNDRRREPAARKLTRFALAAVAARRGGRP